MIQYNSISAFDAHNSGLLAAIRASDRDIAPPEDISSREELEAWEEGVAEGSAIRRAFEPRSSARPAILR